MPLHKPIVIIVQDHLPLQPQVMHLVHQIVHPLAVLQQPSKVSNVQQFIICLLPLHVLNVLRQLQMPIHVLNHLIQ